MSKKNKPVLLAILDGLAHNPNERGNAVAHAKTPTLDKLKLSCPYTELFTHGKYVGLPEGQMGNSEVGHLNIGGGRVVKQDLTIINEAVAQDSISNLTTFTKLCKSVSNDSALHLIGLVSHGGVHSSLEHLKALINAGIKNKVSNIFVHVITDGRDRPTTASLSEVIELESFIEKIAPSSSTNIRIATIIGRYFAMDRDNRWERTKKAYDLITELKGDLAKNCQDALSSQHKNGTTDEFLEPRVLDCSQGRPANIQDNDSLLFFNFRSDRMRQIVKPFISAEKLEGLEIANPIKISQITTLTSYDEEFDVDVLFPPQVVTNHFGKTVAKAGLKQLRVAETEKYPHVTYFFNGGEETHCDGEDRILVPSPRDVATYDLKPEMSAYEITEKLVAAIQSEKFDAIIVNFANCDMVGHTGVFDAAVKAVETVDTCLGRVLSAIESVGGCAIISADHGNSDQMIDYETGEPHTFHTTYPVPLFLFGHNWEGVTLRSGGALCDIAPTLCEMLGIEAPKEMTGKSLIVR